MFNVSQLYTWDIGSLSLFPFRITPSLSCPFYFPLICSLSPSFHFSFPPRTTYVHLIFLQIHCASFSLIFPIILLTLVHLTFLSTHLSSYQSPYLSPLFSIFPLPLSHTTCPTLPLFPSTSIPLFPLPYPTCPLSPLYPSSLSPYPTLHLSRSPPLPSPPLPLFLSPIHHMSTGYPVSQSVYLSTTSTLLFTSHIYVYGLILAT